MPFNENENHIAFENLPGGFDVDDIIAEFGSSGYELTKESVSPSEKVQELEQQSRRLVLEAIDRTVSEASFSSIDDFLDDAVSEVARLEQEGLAAAEMEASAAVLPDESDEEESFEELPAEAEEAEAATEEETELFDSEIEDSSADDAYASSNFEPEELPEEIPEFKDKRDTKERFLSPIIAVLALIALRREQRKMAEQQETEPEYEAEIPEMEPKKAVKLYSAQAKAFATRGKIAIFVCVLMLYVSFAYYSVLPLMGAMKSVRVLSLFLLVSELSVMIIGLDLISSGLMSLWRRSPGVESLIAVSCIFSALDAIVLAAMNTTDFGLPFCVISAISLTCGIWGSYFTCKGYKLSFRVLTAKKLYSVTGERGISGDSVAILKSHLGTDGFITRSEQADITEQVYSVITPLVLVMSVVFAVISAVKNKDMSGFVHSLSVMTAVAATFSATISFSLPFSVAAKALYQSGAAIAGWNGLRDVGKSQQVVITDSDVFPQGTLEISGIRILEGAFNDKVISYTGSVIAASGSGLAAPFSDLIRRNGYSINRVEDFRVHDGGGMTAMVNGENVFVGNTGFMNLMGIRVPQKLATKYSVYTAISGSLVGIFNINYKPVSSVQHALVVLLQSKREPLFAIRDFNITPMMIKQKFRMPTDKFQFPAYSERFRISGAEPGADSRVAAVISREGMGPLVDTADKSKRLFSGVRMGTAISAVGSILGLVIMFLLCFVGAYESAAVTNVVTFMLLWLIPSVVISWGLGR